MPQTGRFPRGAARTGPPLSLTNTIRTLVCTHPHIHAWTYTHSLAFLLKPRAGEPAAGPTICLPNFQISLSSNLVNTELWRGFLVFFEGGVGNKRLELNCSGQNPHEELRCQVGTRPGQPPMELEGATGRVGEGFTQGPAHSILG